MRRLGLNIGLLAALVSCAGASQSAAVCTSFLYPGTARVHNFWLARRLDPLAMLSNEELIDKLQAESEQGFAGRSSTSWATSFLPLDEETDVHDGITVSGKPRKSPVLTELVRRGASALTALINHLSDARPTRRTVSDGLPGRVFLDAYDPRYRDPHKQPTGVNRRNAATRTKTRREFEHYTLTVGDLCYVAIGQIVNRNLDVVRYEQPLCLTVNSPVEVPALAEAVKQDWGGLTTKDHAQSLYQDALDQSSPDAAPDALVRLLFYYPATGRSLAVKLLSRSLFDATSAFDFLDKKLVPAAPSKWADLLERYKREQREGGYAGLLWALIFESTFPKSQMDADRERQKKVSDEILRRFFPTVDTLNPPFLNAVNYYDQTGLVERLTSFHWPGLDDAIYTVYKRSVAATPCDLPGRIERDDLALACAKRLVGRGYDALFRSYFEQRLRAVKRDLTIAERTEGKLPPGDAGLGPALYQRIELYKGFLERLSK